VEERRISVKDNTVKLKVVKTLRRLGFKELELYEAYLQVSITHDLSGPEWDDDYSNNKDV